MWSVGGSDTENCDLTAETWVNRVWSQQRFILVPVHLPDSNSSAALTEMNVVFLYDKKNPQHGVTCI